MIDSNANIVEEETLACLPQDEQGGMAFSDQEVDLIASFTSFQSWLADAEIALKELNLCHMGEFQVAEIETRKERLQALKEDIDDNRQPELKRISLLSQHMCGKHLNEARQVKSELRQARKAVGLLMFDLAGHSELTDTLIPLAKDWEASREAITEFLSAVSEASHAILSLQDRDTEAILDYEAEARNILCQFNEKLPVRDVYVTSCESIVDLVANDRWTDLEVESVSLCRLWRELVALFEQFLNRVARVKDDKEDSKRKEADRIDRQLRREAKQCCCSKPFKIVRLSEGKYTFGDSKIVRLVRIHGSSVVVRVGGGWQFLMEFLQRNDPCRAQRLSGAFADSVDALGLIPLDSSSPGNSFSLQLQRQKRASYSDDKTKVLCRRTVWNADRNCSRRNSCGEASLYGSRDSCSSLTWGKEDGAPTDPSSCCSSDSGRQTPKQNGVQRHTSECRPRSRPLGLECNRSLESVTLRLGSNDDNRAPIRRVSLVERQNEYAAKRRSLNSSLKSLEIK